MTISTFVLFWLAGANGDDAPYTAEAATHAWEALQAVGKGLGPSVSVLVPLVSAIVLGFYLAVIGGQLGSQSDATFDVLGLQERLTLAAQAAGVGVGILVVIRVLSFVGHPTWPGRALGAGAEIVIIALLSIELGSQLLLNQVSRRRATLRMIAKLHESRTILARRMDRNMPRKQIGQPAVFGRWQILLILVAPSIVPCVLAVFLYTTNVLAPALFAGLGVSVQLLFGVGYATYVSTKSKFQSVVALVYPRTWNRVCTAFVGRALRSR